MPRLGSGGDEKNRKRKGMTLKEVLADDTPEPRRQRKEPLWKGPEEDGITFSLLSRWLSCRERARLLFVEGLKAQDQFNHRIEFGQMWHICEESLASAPDKDEPWEVPLLNYARELGRNYPADADQVRHWYEVAKLMFPIYVGYWREHPDVREREPLLQEEKFGTTLTLPSTRRVKLRGKWDSVDKIGADRTAAIYIQENKTKGEIKEQQLKRQLTFDLQTMIYVIALGEKQDSDFWNRSNKRWRNLPIGGVRYNVIKRPRHYKGKKETHEQFYERLEGIVQESPHEFFYRWKVEVTSADILRFRRQCLDPILETLCNWWDWIKQEPHNPFHMEWHQAALEPPYKVYHWRHPFGVYNILDEGGASDLDEYLSSGSEVGLQRTDNLYPELT